MAVLQNMPIEILSHIMSFMDFSTRREAALVCRSWYEANLDPSFLKETKFTFDASQLEEDKRISNGRHLISGCICKSPNLHIVGLEENFNARLFLNLHKTGMGILGRHVEHLSLKNSNVLEGTFFEILQNCENIKSLDLTGCNSLFMSGEAFSNSERIQLAKTCFKNITSLNLSSLRYLNDSILNRLISFCPLLQSITLSSNNMLCTSIAYSMSNLLTFPAVERLISYRALHITRLDFSHTSLLSTSLSTLAKINGLKLKSVVLQYCRELTDKGIVNLVKSQTDITYLDFSGSPEIGDASVFAVSSNLTALKHLKLRKCQKVTSSSVKNLNQLIHLKELDLSECFSITMKALQQGISGLKKLKILQLKCCNLSNFHASFFKDLPKAINVSVSLNSASITQNLVHLDVGSSQYVDDLALQAINFYLINLEVLILSWCSSITDRGLLGLPVEKSSFQETRPIADPTYETKINEFLSSGKYSANHGQGGFLQRPGCEFIADKIGLSESEVTACMEAKGIIRLKRLKKLSLANCKKLSGIGLLHVFRYRHIPFPNLESLDLGMLYQAVTDDTLKAVAFSTTLRRLSLAFCGMITDTGIQHLCQSLHSLDVLNLSNCDGITQKSLLNLSISCPWLRELDMSMCRQISVQMVSELTAFIPSLLKLHTRYTGGASLDKTL